MTSRPLRASGTKAAWMGVGSKYAARWRAASTGGESERAWKPLGLSTSIAVDKQTSKEMHTLSIGYQLFFFSQCKPFRPPCPVAFAAGRACRADAALLFPSSPPGEREKVSGPRGKILVDGARAPGRR